MSKKYKFLLVALLVALVGCDKKESSSSSFTSSNSITSSVFSSNSSDSTSSSEVSFSTISTTSSLSSEESSSTTSSSSTENSSGSSISQGLEFALNNDGNSYSVTDIGMCKEMNIVIPDIYDNKPVTSIESYAFFGCDWIISITIPNSITSIGRSAFYNCYRLVEIYNLSNLELIKGSSDNGCISAYALDIYTDKTTPSKLSIDNNGFILHSNETIIAYIGNATEITIPNEITSVGNYAFLECQSLTSVTIHNKVTTIGDGAFKKCESLKNITIPSSVTVIGKDTFAYCNSFTNIIIPDSVTSIGDNAFFDCASLISVTLGTGLTSIGAGGFSCCYKLVEVYNLSNLRIKKEDESNGFVGFYAIDIYTDKTTPSKLSIESNGLVIHTDGNNKTIISYTEKTSQIEISNDITSIKSWAFRGYSSLINLIIGNSLTSIGFRAFYDCKQIENIYYYGTKTDWNKITFDSGNNNLTSAKIYYYSDIEPQLNVDGTGYDGNYWHYIVDEKTPIIWEKTVL